MDRQKGPENDSSYTDGAGARGEANPLDRQISGACEEISDDAYRQNYVYRAWKRGVAGDKVA